MDKFIRRQSSIKGKLTKIKTALHQKDASGNPIVRTPEEIQVFLEDLGNVWAKAESTNDDIIDLCADSDEVNHQVDAHTVIFELYAELRSTLLQMQTSAASSSSAGAAAAHSSSSRRVKLPSVELPKFEGNYETWPSFQDLFNSTIDSDASLSDSEKLKYLKYSVKGEPEVLIRSLSITNANYQQAWKILRGRYNNKREIVGSLLKRLFNQQRIQKECSTSLKKLLDTTNECLLTLQVLLLPTEHWDDIIVHLTVEKLDPVTRKYWAMQLSGTDLPKYKQLQEFLEQRISGLRASSDTTTEAKQGNHHHRVSTNHGTIDFKCSVCKQNHQTFKCEKFKNLSVQERINTVKRVGLCFNCLRSDHRSIDCNSNSKCKKCRKSHHTMLHLEKRSDSQPDADASSGGAGSRTFSSNLASSDLDENQVLLSTAVVSVKDSNGEDQLCRLLLDSGSQATLITEHCMSRLGLARNHTSVRVTGISSSSSEAARGEVNMKLISNTSNQALDITAFILPKVTGAFPKIAFNQQHWKHIRGLPLADPLYNKPDKIDILLGADYLGEVMLNGKRAGKQGEPTAQNTIFGWILSGKVPLSLSKSVSIHHVECDIDKILRRFWEVEELPPVKYFTETEKQCEEHFVKTHTRDSDGRFIVELPFNGKQSNLGSSKQLAIGRLKSVEKRVAMKPEFREQYNKFMREYEQLGHMQLVPDDELGEKVGKTHYLPHHFVLKLDSSSTKFRVVFDGSARSSTGLSINDCLLVGPTIQDDLLTLLIRFRIHLIAVKSDIVKMYRQFKMKKEHADFQRILWRESPELPMKEYRLTTVTYGTASAPFTATRCLQQVGNENMESSPETADTILNDVYVDDMVSGRQSLDKAIKLQQESTSVLSQAQLDQSKWSSNSQEFLSTIPMGQRETDSSLPFDSDNTIKALGIQWKPNNDEFAFSVSDTNICKKPTKRTLLSELAKVFDPIGFLSPFTIRAKLLLQSLWKLKLDWDDVLPDDLIQSWLNYYSEFSVIKEITIPRCLITEECQQFELHGFSDASIKAFAACVYLKSLNSDGTYTVRLVTAKTKVAPILQESLPRLELCGALMCAELLHSVQKALKITCSLHGWTDNTIVLRWIAAFPGRWSCYIGNRVAKIQHLLPSEQWRHVPTHFNPADPASRGISATELQSSSLWWNGPDWLRERDIPLFTPLPPISGDLEEKKKSVLVAHISDDMQLYDKYSSYTKLLRITAFCIRFIKMKTKQVPVGSYGAVLTPAELEFAANSWIKRIQSTAFQREINDLRTGGGISPKSKLLPLTPFIDASGLLRVSGRLQNADIPEAQKFPIILPHDHTFTMLLIRSLHLKLLHGGFQLLWSTLQQSFWIFRARGTIRNIIRKCIPCRRQRTKTTNQLMGSLPSSRVNPAKVFSNVGVDYAGPIQLKVITGRSNKLTKGYFVIFVCMATKAIHLEVVRDMTTEAFIAAFTRFVSRRGPVANIFSDCGTNFVGADKVLQQLWRDHAHHHAIANHISSTGITWHFNPPAAPNQGGLWEAGVKSVKSHLKKTIGTTTLSYDEFETVLCQVEACLNSRPLCSLSTDPHDLNALTPGHFLVGGPLTSLPHPDFTETKVNRLSRWQLTVQMAQHFWRRWREEYLSTLQQRFIWSTKRTNLHVNDLVLLKDENHGPLHWKMGRVIDVHPGKDSQVRVVTLRTATGVYKRPTNKLCPLLSHDE